MWSLHFNHVTRKTLEPFTWKPQTWPSSFLLNKYHNYSQDCVSCAFWFWSFIIVLKHSIIIVSIHLHQLQLVRKKMLSGRVNTSSLSSVSVIDFTIATSACLRSATTDTRPSSPFLLYKHKIKVQWKQVNTLAHVVEFGWSVCWAFHTCADADSRV